MQICLGGLTTSDEKYLGVLGGSVIGVVASIPYHDTNVIGMWITFCREAIKGLMHRTIWRLLVFVAIQAKATTSMRSTVPPSLPIRRWTRWLTGLEAIFLDTTTGAEPMLESGVAVAVVEVTPTTSGRAAVAMPGGTPAAQGRPSVAIAEGIPATSGRAAVAMPGGTPAAQGRAAVAIAEGIPATPGRVVVAVVGVIPATLSKAVVAAVEGIPATPGKAVVAVAEGIPAATSRVAGGTVVVSFAVRSDL